MGIFKCKFCCAFSCGALSLCMQPQPPLQRNTELVILHLNIDTAFCVRAASAQRAYTPTATVSHPALTVVPFIFSEYVYIQYILISLSGSCLGGTPTAEWNILNTRFSCFVRSFWLSHCQLQRTDSSVKGAHYHMTKVQNFDQFHLMEEAIRNRQMLCKIMCTLNLKYFIRRTCFHSQTWTSVCSVSNCTSCLF